MTDSSPCHGVSWDGVTSDGAGLEEFEMEWITQTVPPHPFVSGGTTKQRGGGRDAETEELD
jgi:hypothetical protein